MARIVALSAWTAVLAFGSSLGCSGGESPTAAGAGGNGGSSASSTTGVSSSTATHAASSVGPGPTTGAGGSGGSPMPFVCDPPAEPGSIFERTAVSLDIEQVDPVSMCKYRGDVMLIVNTAAV